MPIECIKCKTENADINRFCYNCGTSVDVKYGPLRDALSASLQEQVQAMLKENAKTLEEDFKSRYKDQSAIELETAQKITTRLSEWAKLFAYFVAIPLGILLLLFSVLGFTSYLDVSKRIDGLKNDISAKQNQLAKLEPALNKVNLFDQQVKQADQDAKDLNEQFKTVRTQLKAVTVSQTQVSRDAIQAYFRALGPQLKFGLPKVVVISDPNSPSYKSATYNSQKKVMEIGQPLVNNTSVVNRQYADYALQQANLVTLSARYAQLEGGLADYFACSFSNDPVIGNGLPPAVFGQIGYLRNLDTHHSLDELHDEKDNTGRAWEIWGSAFWAVRKELGQSAADKILYAAWQSLTEAEIRGDNGVHFVRRLLEENKTLNGAKSADQIRAVFTEHGLKL